MVDGSSSQKNAPGSATGSKPKRAKARRWLVLGGALASRVLARGADHHPRRLDGTHCPLPAIPALVRTGKLAEMGYPERALLDEIDRHSPLLFDFVLKRTVRGPGGEQLVPSVFMPPAELFPG